MQLLLIRHGQSQGNIDQIIQDDHDPLTDLGRLQSDLLGQHLAAEREVRHLYASPLARARETAEIIGRWLDLEPILEPGLAEMNAGDEAGMPWSDWRALNPELAERFRSHGRTLEDRWRGGENGREFRLRVLEAYDRIVEQHRETDDVVAVVSHGGSLAWIASRVFGDPEDVWPIQRATFANGSISEIAIDRDGVHSAGSWNQQEHLLQDR